MVTVVIEIITNKGNNNTNEGDTFKGEREEGSSSLVPSPLARKKYGRKIELRQYTMKEKKNIMNKLKKNIILTKVRKEIEKNNFLAVATRLTPRFECILKNGLGSGRRYIKRKKETITTSL